MPITYEIDRAQKTVFTRASGILTKEEIFAYQRELQSSPEPRYFNECIDMTAVTDIEAATDKNMVDLADLSIQMDDPTQMTRLAIIAVNDLHFGLARMYETYRSMRPKNARQVSVFRTREEALRWLSGERTTS